MARHLNLLPPERREHLRRGALLVSGTRLVKTLGSSLIVLSIGAAVLIVGLWIATITFSTSSDAELEKQVKDYVALKGMISGQNQLLDLVNALGQKRVLWSELLNQFQETVPPGTTIDTFTADASSGNVSFSGRALTRNALVVFEERLNQLPWVAGVTAPRRNLLQRNNPDYSFDIKLDWEKAEMVSRESK